MRKDSKNDTPFKNKRAASKQPLLRDANALEKESFTRCFAVLLLVVASGRRRKKMLCISTRCAAIRGARSQITRAQERFRRGDVADSTGHPTSAAQQHAQP